MDSSAVPQPTDRTIWRMESKALTEVLARGVVKESLFYSRTVYNIRAATLDLEDSDVEMSLLISADNLTSA